MHSFPSIQAAFWALQSMFRNHQQQWIVYAPGAEIHLGLDVEQVDQCENSERDQVSKSPNTLHVSGLFLTPHGVFFELTRTEWAVTCRETVGHICLAARLSDAVEEAKQTKRDAMTLEEWLPNASVAELQLQFFLNIFEFGWDTFFIVFLFRAFAALPFVLCAVQSNQPQQ